MWHPQPPTPIRTDNSIASGITNNTIIQRRSRSMDMRFYWVRDRVQQGQLIVYWGPGKDNLGDFYTKHHPPTHCRLHRKHYVHDKNHRTAEAYRPDILQGCANLGINLGTRNKDLTTRSHTQNPRLRLSQTVNTYLTKYLPH